MGDSAPAAPTALTASPPASVAVAVEDKPTVLVAEKLGAAGLVLVREFAIDCSYDLSLEEFRAKVSLSDALIVRSGTRSAATSSRPPAGSDHRQAGVGIDDVDLTTTEHGCLVVNRAIANTAADHKDRSSDMSQIRQLDFMYLSYFDVHLNCFEV
ncbi:hypothetical protein ZWY2020_007890 [Hordeum vulgare]|nr:hypothetical protein ZWY2020_007890 [Hordeum vulgare]